MKVPKDTVSIYVELKGICYEEERYCGSFSPTDKDMIEHFWNNPKTYVCTALDENGNEIGDNQE